MPNIPVTVDAICRVQDKSKIDTVYNNNNNNNYNYYYNLIYIVTKHCLSLLCE